MNSEMENKSIQNSMVNGALVNTENDTHCGMMVTDELKLITQNSGETDHKDSMATDQTPNGG